MGRAFVEGEALKDFGPQLERLLNRIKVLGMACEALDNVEHKNALSVGLGDAQTIVEDMIELLRSTPRHEPLAAPPSLISAQHRPDDLGELAT